MGKAAHHNRGMLTQRRKAAVRGQKSVVGCSPLLILAPLRPRPGEVCASLRFAGAPSPWPLRRSLRVPHSALNREATTDHPQITQMDADKPCVRQRRKGFFIPRSALFPFFPCLRAFMPPCLRASPSRRSPRIPNGVHPPGRAFRVCLPPPPPHKAIVLSGIDFLDVLGRGCTVVARPGRTIRLRLLSVWSHDPVPQGSAYGRSGRWQRRADP